MPGENSNFDASKFNPLSLLISRNHHRIVLAIIVTVQVWGYSRYYFPYVDLWLSYEVLFLSLYFLTTDVLIVKGMYMTKVSDPGYLYEDSPRARLTAGIPPTEELAACYKCGFERIHRR